MLNFLRRKPKENEKIEPVVSSPRTTASKAKPKQKRAPRRDFEKVYPSTAAVHIITAVNPKRPGTKSHVMFEKYYDAKTVADALSMGVSYRQLDYDVQHKFIEVKQA